MSATLTEYDRYLLGEGSHFRSYDKLGAHVVRVNGVEGTHFAVWAPHAHDVAVIGEFNGWDPHATPMSPVSGLGVWERFVPGIGPGTLYKYAVQSGVNEYHADKADPYGFAAEIRPHTASKVWDLAGYQWHDQDWLTQRAGRNSLNAPISIYEVHLGSWRRVPEEGNRWLTYRELAHQLADYCGEMGFTHVELLPITEHPFDGSWGYQTIGYYAPTSRFGTPTEFMYLIDVLHQRGIGVILDWVPAHFPRDEHGLAYFDGTHLYEPADPRRGFQRDWNTFVFDYGRPEVTNFLISNALFWIDQYHIDGLRIDAVASMLYLDYSRGPDDWLPNQFGGRENLEAIAFLRRLNDRVHEEFPGVITIAEESTAWPMVSRPAHLGGLGFDFKWDMGWMHDTLEYCGLDPVYRKYHQGKLTFRAVYAFSENYVLPLSHDEVVYGKGSLLNKMPGDDWRKFAGLRTLLGYQFTLPGKKLLFMGDEFGQWSEWNHDTSLDWHLLGSPMHHGLQRFVRDLNTLYRGERALHDYDCNAAGFQWVDCCDGEHSVIAFLRKARDGNPVLVAFNFTPVPRPNYRLGVPTSGYWQEVLNSDAPMYGGSGQGNLGGLDTSPVFSHGHSQSINATLPPLGMVVFRPGARP